MFKFLALVVLATVASAATYVPRSFLYPPVGRIVGGENITIENVPYQVSVQKWGEHNCGGSIISKYYVLTANHCVSSDLVRLFSVRAGTSYENSGGSKHTIAEIVEHEHFNTTNLGTLFNDIALIRVNEPFEFDETRQPIELFDEAEESEEGSLSVVTGWGRMANSEKPSMLQTVTVPIVTKKSCNEAYSESGGLPAGQICAAYPEGGKDACSGDSGGPLAINNRLAGIVSWGRDCAAPGKPGVYTEVAFFRAWIKAHSGI